MPIKPKTTRNRILCPDCQGEGTVFIPVGIENENTDVVCPLCKGKRVVFEIVTTAYETVK